MAMNLHLREETEEALRAESARTRMSQQEIIQEAIDKHLGLIPTPNPTNDLEDLIAAGKVRRARIPYRTPRHRLTLPEGVTTADLINEQREERLY